MRDNRLNQLRLSDSEYAKISEIAELCHTSMAVAARALIARALNEVYDEQGYMREVAVYNIYKEYGTQAKSVEARRGGAGEDSRDVGAFARGVPGHVP